MYFVSLLNQTLLSLSDSAWPLLAAALLRLFIDCPLLGHYH